MSTDRETGRRSCIDRLRHEHEVAAHALGALEVAVDRLARGEAAGEHLAACLDFLASFLEGVHERREEEALFPVLAGHGLELERGPLAVLRGEHERGRRLLRAIRETVAEGLAAPLGRVRAYLTQVRAHLGRESAVLFPCAARLLTAEDEAAVARASAAVDAAAGGAAALDALEAVAVALERAAGAADGRPVKIAGPSWCVGDVMRTGVPALGPGDSLARAVGLMETVGVRELPVVDAGRVVGIVARRDLQPHVGQFEWTTVRTAMTADPFTVAAEATVETVARLLSERGYNAVPVTDARGALLGMVSCRDLLRLLAAGDEGVADPVRTARREKS